MKLFNRISLLLISSLVFAACERDYDAPPLNEPKYDGPAANTTIEELRAMGATVGEDAPYTIGEEKVMKAVITANDESGNIFKKIYLQDETGAIVGAKAKNLYDGTEYTIVRQSDILAVVE